MALVTGDSMLPLLRPGDRLLVVHGGKVRAGSLVLARFADGTVAVKRAAERRTTRDGSPAWWLLSDNPTAGVDSRHRGPVRDATSLAVVRARLWPRAPSAVTRLLWKTDRSWRSETERGSAPVRGRPGLRPPRRRQARDGLDRALTGREELSLAYTPGVARVCVAIAEDPTLTQHYTWVPNVVAVVTDGTAVLGLGDIGPAAAMPVMEGKAVLFKQFGGVDAVPICLATTDTEEIIETVARLAPSFGGINLEDISAPRCFEIEDRLKGMLDIPVFHDDQHGTAVVALAALHQRAAADRARPGHHPGGDLGGRRRRCRGGQDPARARASATSPSPTARGCSTPGAPTSRPSRRRSPG